MAPSRAADQAPRSAIERTRVDVVQNVGAGPVSRLTENSLMCARSPIVVSAICAPIECINRHVHSMKSSVWRGTWSSDGRSVSSVAAPFTRFFRSTPAMPGWNPQNRFHLLARQRLGAGPERA